MRAANNSVGALPVGPLGGAQLSLGLSVGFHPPEQELTAGRQPCQGLRPQRRRSTETLTQHVACSLN